MAAVEDPLDCLVTHCVVLAAWDDQADVIDMFTSGGVGGLGSGMGWSGWPGGCCVSGC